jgi:hypothetical protein
MHHTVRKRVTVGETITVTMPWSEVMIHMRIVDQDRQVMIVDDRLAQVLNDDGSPFSFAVLLSEAGMIRDTDGTMWADVVRTVRDLPNAYPVEAVEALQDRGQGYDWHPVASPTEGIPGHPVTHPYGDWQDATLETATHVVLGYTVWSDYSGSTVERSNERSLLEDYPQTFIRLYGGHGTSGLMLPVDRPADWFADDEDGGRERWQGLLEDLAKLADYPLYDEEDLSGLETEIADEAWDAYLRSDVLSDLAKTGVPDEALADEAKVRTRFYALTYEADYGPEAESAVSVVFPFYAATLAEIAAEIRAGRTA